MSYRWRVYFSDGTKARDVYANTKAGAERTAVQAERIVGNKKARLLGTRAEKLFEVGYNAKPELFTQQHQESA